MTNVESPPSADNLRQYFSLLCWANAYLFRQYLYQHHDAEFIAAVDKLQAIAEANNQQIIRALGQDEVQELIAQAFAENAP